VSAPVRHEDRSGRILRACPSCGSPQFTWHGSREQLRLVHCATCDLIYSNPQPVESVRAKYLHEYDLAAHFREVEQRKRVLFQRRLQSLGPAPFDGARLCDVGCGDGLFLQMAAGAGWEPFGVEMNPPAARVARQRGANVFQGAVEEIDDLPLGSFDVVCSWDAIEHTPTPHEFADRLSALVRGDSGRIILSTLNTRSLVARITGMRWRMIADGHFTYWNEQSLRHLHAAVGLEVTGVGFFGLGRDLVAPLDRLRPRRAGVAPATGGAPGAGSTWDTRSLVLHAERWVNFLMDRSKLGVGIVVQSRRATNR
jgi:2-polyprenyl-3-methyl-5-hydroxy-6-metoxy-1,4-benzoquinol methylase